jgi:FO synthase
MLPSRKELRRQLRTASRLEANQVTLTSGEDIDNFQEVVSVCQYYGYRSWYHYLQAMLEQVIEGAGSRPVIAELNVGTMPFVELLRLRDTLPLVRLMVHSADDSLQHKPAHMCSPHKTLDARLRALDELGQLGIPTVTGITVGIGESERSWERAASMVSQVHARHGHVQGFAVVPFYPIRFSAMQDSPPVTDEVLLKSVAAVRGGLDSSITLSVEIQRRLHLVCDVARAGACDLGEIHLGGSDYVNLDLPAAIEEARLEARKHGYTLKPRTALMNGFVRRRKLPAEIENLLERQRTFQPREREPGAGGNAAAAM